ncbi:DUF3619 family protein [Polynucleobacter necessarius]|uniref:DUF3619 family protein n=1 Tax=Polynucleobacter necessarius TaxID=576610 RepID=UPI000E090A1E|nr:DUF3619 family protein [Polynucleobacter necessarius]
MKHLNEALSQTQADQFGRASAALLNQGAQALPIGIKDRLHAARMKALSVRKAEKVRAQKAVFAGSIGNYTSSSNGIWDTASWVAPLMVLVFGLIGIAHWQNDSRLTDTAEVDVALLTDDVPPDAYADSGFLAFLKNGPLSDSEDSATELSPSK